MNNLTITIKYFLIILSELIVLFILISALVNFVFTFISKEKVKKWMSGKGIIGNLMGATAGSITPFCACSTVPMAKGFLDAGVNFGSILSFLIASPLLNPIIITMLIALIGMKAAVIYFCTVFLISIFAGLIFNKVKSEKQNNETVKTCSCSAESIVKNGESIKSKIKKSFQSSLLDLKSIALYMVIGVGIGSLIYGYLPQELVIKYAGGDSNYSIFIAALIGIPLYIRTETAIPIGLALMKKGMNIGAVIALIIGGAGMAIPEMTMLASIFNKKTVLIIVFVIYLIAVLSGFVFNLFLN
jgi:hypothetical protein